MQYKNVAMKLEVKTNRKSKFAQMATNQDFNLQNLKPEVEIYNRK